MKTKMTAAWLLPVLFLASCKMTGWTDLPAAVEEPAAVPAEAADSGNEEETMNRYDFSEFSNVTVTGIDISSLNETELAILYTQARYCQAMTDADIDTLRELVSEDMIYVHMSGMKQTREEYFADIADGDLRYYTIGIADPVIMTEGDKGSIAYTSVLNARAYGARGTYRMKGTHFYELREGSWIEVSK